MSIPYRTKRNLRRLFISVLALVLFLVLALLCWVLWLNRYVVYSQDGAKIDFNQSVHYAPGIVPVPPKPSPTVTVHDKAEEQIQEEILSTALSQFQGSYVTATQLMEHFPQVRDRLATLPKGSTIVLELKDVRSYGLYSSEYVAPMKDFDISQVDTLVNELQKKGHYVVAMIPSFQEYYYILENEAERVPYGLPKTGGNGSLWLDRSGPCYWMNPASDGTLTHLIQLISELRGLGFDEVVLGNFHFPDTDQIFFEGDKMEVLNETASTLVKTCATDKFCVSFVRSTADLTLPKGRTRLYLTGVSAANADTEAAKTGLADPAAQVVFITELSDTRYEVFSVLRPIRTED